MHLKLKPFGILLSIDIVASVHSLLRTFGFSLPSLPTIHSSHQSLEQMHCFEAIFENFEAIEVKERLRLNFQVSTSKFVS